MSGGEENDRDFADLQEVRPGGLSLGVRCKFANVEAAHGGPGGKKKLELGRSRSCCIDRARELHWGFLGDTKNTRLI